MLKKSFCVTLIYLAAGTSAVWPIAAVGGVQGPSGDSCKNAFSGSPQSGSNVRIEVSPEQDHIVISWFDPKRKLQIWSSGRAETQRELPHYRKVIFLTREFASQAVAEFIADTKSKSPLRSSLAVNRLVRQIFSVYNLSWHPTDETEPRDVIFDKQIRTSFGFERIIFEDAGSVLRIQMFRNGPAGQNSEAIQTIQLSDNGDIQINNYEELFCSATAINSKTARTLVAQMKKLIDDGRISQITPELNQWLKLNVPCVFEPSQVVPDWLSNLRSSSP